MANEIINSGEILLYGDDNGKEFVSIIFHDENFWLTQSGMAELFDCTTDNISLHLKNIYKEKELEQSSTTENFSVVASINNSCESYTFFKCNPTLSVEQSNNVAIAF